MSESRAESDRFICHLGIVSIYTDDYDEQDQHQGIAQGADKICKPAYVTLRYLIFLLASTSL